jgi:branched-chain amino acid transport system substrate-binding protein
MKRLLTVLAGVLVATAAPVATAQQQGVAADAITLGAYGPITGPAAYIGLAGRDGMNLAIKEINAAGGIHGRKITCDIRGRCAFADACARRGKEAGRAGQSVRHHVGGGQQRHRRHDRLLRDKGVVMYVSIASAPPVTWPFARNLFRGGTTETARYGELYAEYLATNAQEQAHRDHAWARGVSAQRGEATIDKLKSWFSRTGRTHSSSTSTTRTSRRS